MMHLRSTTRSAIAVALCAGLLSAACGDDGSAGPSTASSTTSGSTTVPVTSTITLVTHDSFVVTDSVLAGFTASTGIAVKVLKSGDAGELVSKAVLTKDAPLGDVMFGVDNTFLSRAVDAKIFRPYKSPALPTLESGLTDLVPNGEATPIDTGDVCVNADLAGLAAKKTAVPATLDDLAKPEYSGQLVVENPATSSPGLAFMLATIAKYGDGWLDYWKQLKANGVGIVDGWDQAYNTEFSGSAGGKAAKATKTLVVSYASSPPAEVIFGDPKPATAPTSVLTSSCFRQIEFAGILAGTKHAAEAEALVDFLLSSTFQADMPLQMFVFPAVKGVALPPEFEQFATRPTTPLTLAPDKIAADRDRWIEQWTDLMLH